MISGNSSRKSIEIILNLFQNRAYERRLRERNKKDETKATVVEGFLKIGNHLFCGRNPKVKGATGSHALDRLEKNL